MTPQAIPIRSSIAAVVVLAAVLAVALPSQPAFGAKSFATYTSCGVGVSDAKPVPSKSCSQGSAWGAVLIARKRSHVRYKLCVRLPNDHRDCYSKETGKKGKVSFVKFWGPTAPHLVGKYLFTWRVKDKGVIDRDRFELRSEGV